ncbi:TonB-dependent receptor domain-containing protein [Helicobacter sp. 23-1048]
MIKNHFIHISLALCMAHTTAIANQIESNKGGEHIIFLADNESVNTSPQDNTDSADSNSSKSTQKVRLDKSVSIASGNEKNIVDSPASVTVITKEELEQKPYRDLGEALKEVPGVSLEGTSNKLGANAISIRGMPAGYTLYLLDGLRQNPSGDVATANLGVGVYNTFMPPTSAIERIEVIRGPMSTLYGSDALGGVINVITKPISDKWGGSFQTQAIVPESSRFGNSFQNSLYLSGPLGEKWGLNLRARQLTRHGSQKPTDDKGNVVNSFFGSHFVMYNFGGRLTYKPSEQNTYFADIDYSKSTYDNRDGQIGTLGANLSGTNYTGGYEKWVGVNKLSTALAHRGDYSYGLWKNTIQFSRSENTGRLVVGPNTNPNATKNRGIASNDVIVDSRLLAPLFEATKLGSNFLNVGAEYRFENYHDLAATPASHNRNTLAIFAEDEWNIWGGITLTLGARYNYNDKFGHNVSPRAYLVYEILKGWAIKGGVATGYKAPYANQTIDAVYGYGRQGALPFIGNPNLKAESSISYEIGTVLDMKYVDFSLTLFRSNFRDKIESQSVTSTNNAACSTSGATTCSMAYNANSAYSQGIETSFGLKPLYGFSLDMSYTFIDSEITSGSNQGNPLSTTARNNLFGKIAYQYSRFNVFLQAHFREGIVNTTTLGNSAQAIALKELLGGIYYKPSTVLNLGAGVKITDNVRVNAGIYNLLDTNLADFRSYTYMNGNNSTNANVSYYGPVIQEGRRYFVNIVLDF